MLQYTVNFQVEKTPVWANSDWIIVQIEFELSKMRPK